MSSKMPTFSKTVYLPLLYDLPVSLTVILFEFNRQEKLEQLAIRYHRKAGMRESWLNENQRLVSQDNFGYDLAAVEAATKKHEAIETDINAYEERVQAVVAVANELEAENFHDIERINARSVPHTNPLNSTSQNYTIM